MCRSVAVCRKFYCLSAEKLKQKDVFKMNPEFVTGFTDGEGCFLISVTEETDYKVGWEVRPCFVIHLNEKDFALLEWIKNFFCVGTILYKQKTKSFMFSVHSMRDLKIIMDHFEKYPLITQKRADFELFKQVYYLKEREEHRTLEGLKKIVAIRASMNQGLKRSPKLISAFPDVIPVARPLVSYTDQKIKDPQWVAGFTSGEGCFFIDIYKLPSNKQGEAVKLVFKITQHSRD